MGVSFGGLGLGLWSAIQPRLLLLMLLQIWGMYQ